MVSRLDAEPVPKARIGCAGWALEKSLQPLFPGSGTHLQRYAGIFSCVEINSSFYRPHKPDTYARWADSVPPSFRFSVKMPKEITHELGLEDCQTPLDRFLSEVNRLGGKLGPLLVQLPPSARFDPDVAGVFFREFRQRHAGAAVVEPRHASWFGEEAESLLEEWRIARAGADPAVVPEAAMPSGWQGTAYLRLHGSPRRYYSGYSEPNLMRIATEITEATRATETYCIFDNTAEGHAIPDAMRLAALLAAASEALLPVGRARR